MNWFWQRDKLPKELRGIKRELMKSLNQMDDLGKNEKLQELERYDSHPEEFKDYIQNFIKTELDDTKELLKTIATFRRFESSFKSNQQVNLLFRVLLGLERDFTQLLDIQRRELQDVEAGKHSDVLNTYLNEEKKLVAYLKQEMHGLESSINDLSHHHKIIRVEAALIKRKLSPASTGLVAAIVLLAILGEVGAVPGSNPEEQTTQSVEK